MLTLHCLASAALGAAGLSEDEPESTTDKTTRWACGGLGNAHGLYTQVGSPPFKEYDYRTEPMESITRLAPECGSQGLCSSVRGRLVKAFQQWDASRDNASHGGATVVESHTQDVVQAAFAEVAGTLGLRNFLRLLRDANELSTSLTCSRQSQSARCRLVKERDPLNSNLRINLHLFGRHVAETLRQGKLKMSRTAVVQEFALEADVVQALHGSTWTFTVRVLEDWAKSGKPIWRNYGEAGSTTAGSVVTLTSGAAAIMGNITQELCGPLDLLKAFHCVHGMGHAASYVALMVLQRELDAGKQRPALQLPQAMTRGATLCAAASSAISELPRFERSKVMFEWGCSAGVWMVTYQRQAVEGSLVHDAMLKWKAQGVSMAVATQPLTSPPSSLQRAAQRVGPCALEPMRNYPVYCFAWWFSPSLPGGEQRPPKTPPDLTTDDCLLVAVAANADVGAGCAFAMANRYRQTMGRTPASTVPKDLSQHLVRCEGYRRSQATGAAALKLKRRLWLACLAGVTMKNVESALASLRQLRATSFAASCAQFAADPVEMGACLSPALILSGSSDCLTNVLGFYSASRGGVANTMARPDAFEQYERARDSECTWSAPQRADALTAPGKLRVGYHGNTPPLFTALLRDQWRNANLDLERDRAIDPPLLGRRCALEKSGTFIFRLGPLDLAPAQSVLFSFDWPFGSDEARDAAAAGGYVAGFLGAIDQHGRLVGNPPLHFHHAMTWRGPLPMPEQLSGFFPYRTFVDTHFLGATGDRQCQAVEGGPRCSFLELPNGTRLRWFGDSMPVIEGILINEGLAPLTNLSIEMAVRVAAARDQRVAATDVVQLTFMLTMPMDAPFGTVAAPQGESVHFTSWHMPLAGRVVASDFHTHGKKGPLKQVWIVAASAATLGLERDGAGFKREDPAQPVPLRSLRLDETGRAPVTLDVLQAYLKRSLLQARASERERLLCVISTDSDGETARIPRQHAFDGQPPACATWRFLRGDALTIIAFMDAGDVEGAHVHAQWYPVVSFDDGSLSR